MHFVEQVQKLNIECHVDEPLSRHTTFHIGGPARYFAVPEDEGAFVALLRLIGGSGLRFFVLGRGSNLLVSDDGFDGVVISTARMQSVRIADDGTVHAECGAQLRVIANAAADASLTGMEFAHGIPGSLGGAVRMNAGAYGGEMAQVVTSIRCYNTKTQEIETIGAESLCFSHRNSVLSARSELLLLSATLQLRAGDASQIRDTMAELRARRQASQPLEYPSAGSVFKRPQGYFAGKLIEDCALKGYTIGGAQVSEKHAGFIINRGGATAADVRALVAHIQKTVQDRFDVLLEPEIIFLD